MIKRIFQNGSLKTRVTLLTLALFLSSIWIVTFFISSTSIRKVQNLVSDQQFSTASLVADQINQELEEKIKSLESLALSVSPLMRGNSGSLQAILEQQSAIGLFNSGMFITDGDGIAIASVPLSAERTGVNFMDRDHIRAALKEGKTTISRPGMGKMLMAPVITLVVPVRDARSQVIGVLAGVTDLSKSNFLDKITQHTYGNTGGYVLASPQDKLFVTGTDKNFIMKPFPPLGVNALLDRYVQGFEGSGVVKDARDVVVLSAAKRIPITGWFLVVRMPLEEAFAPIHEIQKRMSLVVIFMSLVTVCLTWWMLKRQLAPMLTAVRILDSQPNSGLPSKLLPVSCHDEIGKLMSGFNRLLETLRQRDLSLRASRKQLSNIIEFLPDATLAIDKEKRVIIWNKAIEKMTGIPASEMIGEDDHAYTIPFYGVRRRQMMDLIFENDEEIGSLYPWISREGDALTAEVFCSALYGGKGAWIFLKAGPLYDQNGSLIGAIESIRDITERKLVEQNYQILFNEMLDGFAQHEIINDEAGNPIDYRFLAVNPAFERITGLKAADLIGRRALEVMPGIERSLIGTYGKVAITGQPAFFENYADDIQKYFKVAVFRPMPGQFVCIFSDITERKIAEDEKKKMADQLQHAQKMEAIGTLAGGIAHDFNNILGAILGYAEMAREDCPQESILANDLDQVVLAATRAKDLVKQILTFSRQTETERIPIQPAIMVKETIKMLRSSLPTTIDIQQDIDAEASFILADPTHIHQILMNLCTNAYHALEETGGILSISLRSKVLSSQDLAGNPYIEPGDFLELSVKDNGSGIPLAIQNKIFDPYFTTKETGKGTGMGLAIVHGIIKKYGGFITCTSTVREGTVFNIFLPIFKGQAYPEIKPLRFTVRGTERILFVDDEDILAKMGQTLLERLGYTVTVRTDSLEALAAFQNQPDGFDLVITDQTMPGITGIDLARKILQIRPDMPIILCTGYSSQISAEKARSYGIKGFAMKPLHKKDITTLIRKVLDEGNDLVQNGERLP